MTPIFYTGHIARLGDLGSFDLRNHYGREETVNLLTSAQNTTLTCRNIELNMTELRLLGMVANEGLTTNQMAARRKVSERTVKNQLLLARRKNGVHTTVELAIRAEVLGLLHPFFIKFMQRNFERKGIH